MNTRHDESGQARSFEQDVERLRAGEAPTPSADAGYEADLALAGRLVQARSRPDARFESRLHNHLLAELYRQQEEKVMNGSRGFRGWLRPLVMATTAAVMLFGMMLIVSPDARAAAGGLVTRFVAAGSVAMPRQGENGPAALAGPVPSAPSGAGELQAAAQPGAGAGQASPAGVLGQAPAVKKGQPALPALPSGDAGRQLISLKEAQAQVAFRIKVPAVLPAGYKLLGVSAPLPGLAEIGKDGLLPGAGRAPEPPARAGGNSDAAGKPAPALQLPQNAILVFGNDAGDRLMLAQSAVGDTLGLEANLQVPYSAIHAATVNGQEAQYLVMGGADSNLQGTLHQLHWQTGDGVLCDLTSAKLGLSDLLAVANSIK